MTTYDAAADRARAARADTPPPFTGLAFSSWAAAFAVGALLHLWSNEQHTWSFGPLAAVAAFAVLLRPASPARIMLLLGLLLAEAALAVPLLLLFHRTRPLAVVLGFGFHLVSAFAGHASFSGFYRSFYLLFLPPATIARAVVLARRSVPRRLRGGLAAIATYPGWAALVPGLIWWLGWLVLPASLESPLRNWGSPGRWRSTRCSVRRSPPGSAGSVRCARMPRVGTCQH